jgi:hypothetical protein
MPILKMKYYVLEDIDCDALNKRVYSVHSLSEAHRLWLESPTKRTIVKSVETEVREK